MPACHPHHGRHPPLSPFPLCYARLLPLLCTLSLVLPLGYIGVESSNSPPSRLSSLTPDEQVTVMSLWTIFRSPLMYGGDLQHPDNFSLALLTNPEALNVSDHSLNTAFLVSNASQAVWRSDSEAWRTDGRSYFTAHNLLDTQQTVTAALAPLRGAQNGSACTLRDVWRRTDVGQVTQSVTVSLRPHASGLYALHSCSNAPHHRETPPTMAAEPPRKARREAGK